MREFIPYIKRYTGPDLHNSGVRKRLEDINSGLSLKRTSRWNIAYKADDTYHIVPTESVFRSFCTTRFDLKRIACSKAS